MIEGVWGNGMHLFEILASEKWPPKWVWWKTWLNRSAETGHHNTKSNSGKLDLAP